MTNDKTFEYVLPASRLRIHAVLQLQYPFGWHAINLNAVGFAKSNATMLAQVNSIVSSPTKGNAP